MNKMYCINIASFLCYSFTNNCLIIEQYHIHHYIDTYIVFQVTDLCVMYKHKMICVISESVVKH